MAKKKKAEEKLMPAEQAPVTEQLITDTIEQNYMPYVMSVIVSRAIPEIDGFKPSHRKLLYTMYKMGLLTGGRTKSANVVGQTMKLNPHGDAAIYETMVRLTRDNASLLHPFVDSKGSFGKQYSSSMAYAASRYTEVKLDKFASELFNGIDKDAVDMMDNYDGTMKEPRLLPTTFPNILVTPNMGIAVGMASNICPFNLSEVCDAAIALLRNPKLTTDKILEIMPAPDFPGGGEIVRDKNEMLKVYETGTGPVRIRSKYRYDKDENCIEILEIPYSTTIEIIMKRLADMIKDNQLREVVDFRDEIDLSGFKLTLDLRRGTDPDALMLKLFKTTKLEDSFSCNFNVIIDSVPRQMGVAALLREWIKFRSECLRRELTFELAKKNDKLHLLIGLGKILLDIDKAIRIIRGTEKDSDVVPNLCRGFAIDVPQAEFICEIRLRNLNREYIINRINEIDSLRAEIADIEETLRDEIKLKKLIAAQLTAIKKKYAQPRRSTVVDASEISVYNPEDHIDNYTAHFFLSAEGYFKKITDKSLRGSAEQKLKDGDRMIAEFDAENISEIAFFTDKGQLYRCRALDFDTCKASELGDYLPAKLGFDEGEKPVFVRVGSEWTDKTNMVFVFENGKGVRVPASAYAVKGTRRKMTGVYSTLSPIVGIYEEQKPFDLLIVTDNDKAIVLSTSLLPLKTTRTSQGSQLITLKKGSKVALVLSDFADRFESTKGYKKLKIPAAPVLLVEKDINKMQLKIDV
ncbi:MAG: topoisomerase IV [Clostridia bacterium]|nr:topoisomerase IV [Clostridia bacterium]